MGFQFKTVPTIIFESGAAARLGEIAKDRMRRPILLTDTFLLEAGLVAPAIESLKAAGLSPSVYSECEADPPAPVVRKAVEAARESKADGVIAIGGGSSMDTAKIVAVLMNSSQSLEEIYGVGNVKDARAPLILAPTTAGTGSEVTDIAVITTEDDQKMGVVAEQLFADVAVLDATLTLGLPREATAATGIDAMVHAIEAYTSKIKKNPVSDALAREALKLLAANIVSACEDPQNLQAREAMLLGAMLAGQAFANAPVAAVHALAYPLGGVFHVPHGLSNSLMLTPVLRFNAEVAAPLYAELGDVIGAEATGGYDARAEAFIAKIANLCKATGVKQRLRDVHVSHNDLPRLAEDAMKVTRLLQNNPREVAYDDALKMYAEAL
ncbi:MAG: iron-containing alcohol dehydrogenase [Alphaproteobacteria bacterium]|nr:iron-containing alcohol dehydrogenase [Alphaproteobacteria bacterium]